MIKTELKTKTLKPRDAATLIIVDSSSGEPKVLLGRRRMDMVFMPGRYVFPGGRVDPADRLRMDGGADQDEVRAQFAHQVELALGAVEGAAAEGLRQSLEPSCRFFFYSDARNHIEFAINILLTLSFLTRHSYLKRSRGRTFQNS